MLETVNEGAQQSIVGGAVCIDSSGLLLTVAHILRLSCTSTQQLEYTGRGYRDTDFRLLDVLQVYDSLDLAVVRVNSKFIGEGENFDCISIEDYASLEVDRNEEVVSHLHAGRLPFSTKSGFICYPFVHNLEMNNTYQQIFDNLDNTVASYHNTTDEEDRTRKGREKFEHLEYRNALRCIDWDDKSLNDLHFEMPLIQVQGFGNTAGMSGCPVFRKSDGHMIGLFSFVNYHSQFIIPTSFLRYVVQRWMAVLE